ncbi:hypothetical protein [Yersinia ruckeri]|uniref:hypothetical protein n=1 Tax=Yersinia ruckeri TaxID=29486 RepID=UPI0008FE144B|nr:hypothetical protein [Yersinia ruckeri]OJB95761.1 hypothetical protein AXW59_07400 [Yersinia ruckeri]OJB98562.1 hypothetical protein AXW58_07380 [Yersinia ruckeri]OJC00210.1 hypothetical protein AXW57_07395 [Yersinia ruckeri]
MTYAEMNEARKLYSSLNEQELEQAGQVATRQEKALKVSNMIKVFEQLPDFDREAFGILVDEYDFEGLDTALYDVLFDNAKWQRALEIQRRLAEHDEAA